MSISEIPTYADFHKDHKEPVSYGEDGVLVVSGIYSEKTARKLISRFLDERPEDIEIESIAISWHTAPPGHHIRDDLDDPEAPIYWIDRTGKAARYKAWGLVI